MADIQIDNEGNQTTPSSGTTLIYAESTAKKLVSVSDAGRVDLLAGLNNYSTATVSAGYAADTYLAGSAITMPPYGAQVGLTYICSFDMVKTAAGTAAAAVNIRFGTAGTTADASVCAFTFAVGTNVADTGVFTVQAHFRTVGSGTSAVVAGYCICVHHLAATGLITTGASGSGTIITVGGGFNSTVAASIMGISFNGGASFSGTNTVVETRTFNV